MARAREMFEAPSSQKSPRVTVEICEPPPPDALYLLLYDLNQLVIAIAATSAAGRFNIYFSQPFRFAKELPDQSLTHHLGWPQIEPPRTLRLDGERKQSKIFLR